MYKNYTYPTQLALFIIAAFMPQIIGFNGGFLDSAYKLLLVSLLFLCYINKQGIRNVSILTVTFSILIVFSSLCTLAVNSEEPISSQVTYTLSTILLFYVFAERGLSVKSISIREILLTYKIISVFILIASIYNVLLNPSLFIRFYSVSLYSSENACSFFDNKNTFGVFLMYGVLCSCILYIHTRKKIWLYISLFFIVNEMMAMCRTAIFLSIITLALASIYHAGKVTRVMILLLVLAYTLLSSLSWDLSNNQTFDTRSMEARFSYIFSMSHLLRDNHLLFGYGVDESTKYAVMYTGNRYYHNSFLKLLMVGGFVRLFIHIVSLIFATYLSLLRFKRNKQHGSILLYTIFVYIVYSNIESNLLFDTPIASMTSTILVITMPILYSKLSNYEK